MSVVSTPPVPAPRTARRTAARGSKGARWGILAAFALGSAGGAGVSAALVHGQVRIVRDVHTVYVPAPSNPLFPGGGNLQRKV